MEHELYTCPCCGYKTFGDYRAYEGCLICSWEDDPSQADNPECAGGANGVSLADAQENFQKFGGCTEGEATDPIELQSLIREYQKDPNWKPHKRRTE